MTNKPPKRDKYDWEYETTTDSEDGVKCPVCGYTDTDPQSIYKLEEGTTEYYNCMDCDERFTVVRSVTHTWTTQPIHPEFNP